MSDTQIETTRKPVKRPAETTGPTIALGSTNAEITLGTKRTDKAIHAGKAHLNVTIQVDFTRAPPEVNSGLLREGFTYLLRQEVAKVEKEIETEREEANKKGLPYAEPDLNARVRAAVEKRLDGIYNGDLGRRKNSHSPVERRAMVILRDAIAAHLRSKGKAVSNAALDELTENAWKENANNIRADLTKRAEEAMAEEAKRSASLVNGLNLAI